MKNASCLPLLLLLSISSSPIQGENIMGVENDEFDFDGLPGAQHDFKIYLGAGTEECFWQPVAQGAQLYARFEVLKGGDKEVDFSIRDVTGQVLNQKTGANGFFSRDGLNQGVYGVCIDNVYDRFGFKVVYVYLVSLVMQEWMQYQEELSAITNMAQNFSRSLQNVGQSLAETRISQSRTRFDVVRDWYLANSNLYYVGMWSMIQCAVIIFASCAQVFFVRRLFRMTTTTPTTAKPRA